MFQFIYVWYSSERFYNTNLPFIYVGSHKGNLEDSYISSSKFLSIEMALDELSWKRLIVAKFDLRTERHIINEKESMLIKKAFNRYGKSRCVNMTYNQFGNKHFNAKGFSRLVNNKTGKIEWIPKHLKHFLLNNGYSLTNGSTLGKICITNKSNNKFINQNNKLEIGWNYGMTINRPSGFSSIPKGSICINMNDKHKFILIESLVKYIGNGWDKGFSDSLKCRLKTSSQKGKLRLEKNGEIKFIDSKLLDIYIDNGWSSSKGTIPKGSICINNGSFNKYIGLDELDSHIENGWIKGMLNFKSNKGKRWINNGLLNRYINSNELSFHINNNWKLGKNKTK